jgi:hypothetical protein
VKLSFDLTKDADGWWECEVEWDGKIYVGQKSKVWYKALYNAVRRIIGKVKL